MNRSACKLTGNGNGFPQAAVGTVTFSWILEDEIGYQAKYRLVIHETGASSRTIYDTGWVDSCVSAGVSFDCSDLPSNRAYSAQIFVVSREGKKFESQCLPFFTGLKNSDWTAGWLKQYYVHLKSAPQFRKNFEITKKVTCARLYISGLGYYEAYINGKKVGDHLLDPAWTTWDKRVLYEVYNVEDMLRSGSNTIGVLLGHGWFCMLDRINVPMFTLQMILDYADGSTETIRTSRNDGWQVSTDGPILHDSVFDGEVYDARYEMPGWCTPEYQPTEDVQWCVPLETEPPLGQLWPQSLEPIKVVEELEPARFTRKDAGRFVIDFGKNSAGVVRIKLDEPRNTIVKIRHAEIVDPDGEINILNLRDAKAEDIYISNGEPAIYQPRFTYHGFRYVEISGLTKELARDDIRLMVIRSAVEKKSEFHCGNPLINGIQDICVRTESNNLHGVPTDCPQRDERLGWLNDLTVRAEEAVYNFDLHNFFAKYTADIADVQGEKTGAITDTVPHAWYGNAPADPVSSSFLILPWLLYMHYGDKEILVKHYDDLSHWVMYLNGTATDGLVDWGYYGDWASPITESVAGSQGASAVSAKTPLGLMSTGFLHYNARQMKEMARILGKDGDIEKWNQIEQQTLSALNRTYLNEEKGYYALGSQGANTFMLYLNVVPEKQRARVLQALAQDVLDHNVHITTGNICTKYILEVLTENGYLELAYKLVTQTTYPSWGYMLSKGATTIWERWEYVDSGEQLAMASHDHPMYATVSAWFYKYLLGIQPTEPGFAEFMVKPYFPEELDHAQGHVRTVKGNVEVRWEKKSGKIVILIRVPFNATCVFVNTLDKNDGAKMILPPGEHRLVI